MKIFVSPGPRSCIFNLISDSWFQLIGSGMVDHFLWFLRARVVGVKVHLILRDARAQLNLLLWNTRARTCVLAGLRSLRALWSLDIRKCIFWGVRWRTARLVNTFYWRLVRTCPIVPLCVNYTCNFGHAGHGWCCVWGSFNFGWNPGHVEAPVAFKAHWLWGIGLRDGCQRVCWTFFGNFLWCSRRTISILLLFFLFLPILFTDSEWGCKWAFMFFRHERLHQEAIMAGLFIWVFYYCLQMDASLVIEAFPL